MLDRSARSGAGFRRKPRRRRARRRAIEFFVEARYPDQVWEIEVPMRRRDGSFGADGVDAARRTTSTRRTRGHLRLRRPAIADRGRSPGARAAALRGRDRAKLTLAATPQATWRAPQLRGGCFSRAAAGSKCRCSRSMDDRPDEEPIGPAIVESPVHLDRDRPEARSSAARRQPRHYASARRRIDLQAVSNRNWRP